MHIPDGFIDAPVSLAAAVTSAGVLAVAVRKGRDELDDRLIPMAGLTAAFVFAMQMVNFPVAAGTSGHLLGGLLAAALVGPWLGAISIAVVLFVQALLFADGGLSALGLNVLNMAVVGVLGGYAVLRVLLRLLPRVRGRVPLTALVGVAAWASVMLAAGAFVIEYALGATSDVATSTVATAVLGVHALVGVGEGVITAVVVGTVLAVRPDLVYIGGLLRGPQQLEIRQPTPVVVR